MHAVRMQAFVDSLCLLLEEFERRIGGGERQRREKRGGIGDVEELRSFSFFFLFPLPLGFGSCVGDRSERER